MNQDKIGISSKLNNSIRPEQFDQVVEAILAGKYSWACVLMLRLSGYNPLHYIPYRTYNRLLKENTLASRSNQQHNPNLKIVKSSTEKTADANVSQSCLSKMKDLAYLEVVKNQKVEVRGGSMEQWLTKQVQEYQSIQPELKSENTPDFSLKVCEFN